MTENNGNSLQPNSNNSIRPSRSERPGFPRLLATIMVDPTYFIFKLVAVIVESAVNAIIKAREKRKAVKATKAAKKQGKGGQ